MTARQCFAARYLAAGVPVSCVNTAYGRLVRVRSRSATLSIARAVRLHDRAMAPLLKRYRAALAEASS